MFTAVDVAVVPGSGGADPASHQWGRGSLFRREFPRLISHVCRVYAVSQVLLARKYAMERLRSWKQTYNNRRDTGSRAAT